MAMAVYANRLQSFIGEGEQKPKERGKKGSGKPRQYWPHIRPYPEDLALAGFYFVPSVDEIDNVKCFTCGKELGGWDSQDDPMSEHLNHAGHCPWALARSAADVDTFNGESDCRWDIQGKDMLKARESTLRDWPHESKTGWVGKVKRVSLSIIKRVRWQKRDFISHQRLSQMIW